jgi:hypothetical protein
MDVLFGFGAVWRMWWTWNQCIIDGIEYAFSWVACLAIVRLVLGFSTESTNNDIAGTSMLQRGIGIGGIVCQLV